MLLYTSYSSIGGIRKSTAGLDGNWKSVLMHEHFPFPCIARSLYQPVHPASIQHFGQRLRDLPPSTQSVFPILLFHAISHSVCLCLFLPAPPLPNSSCLPALSCRSACSSHSPNGNRRTGQHDSDDIKTQRTVFVRVLAASGFKYRINRSDALGNWGQGLSCDLQGGA